MKPLKSFPKKYDPSKHGLKDTYSRHDGDAELPLTPPEDSSYTQFHGVKEEPLQGPGSSYDSEIGAPVDPILPPEEESTYIVYANGPSQPMLPPPIDTYLTADGELVDIIVAPAVESESKPEDLSYFSYDAKPEYPLSAPKQSSYAIKTEGVGSDVLSSLATMVRSFPVPSTYSQYNAGDENSKDSLSPPSKESSYDSVPKQGKGLTPEQIESLKEAGIAVPSDTLTSF